MNTALDRVRAALRAGVGHGPDSFLVPRFLVDGGSSPEPVDVGNGHRFLLDQIDKILAGRSSPPLRRRGIGHGERIYLAFPRTFASLDGRVGTALTQLAFLPYLRSNLAPTAFLTLPTGVIGETNRKGSRGSPFAIADPFRIDPSFADPLTPGLDSHIVYRALIEGCNAAGMQSGSIVPMAALAIDCPLFQHFPSLGHWWRAHPDDVLFAESIVRPGGAQEAPTISRYDAARFADPPSSSSVRKVPSRGGPHFVGYAPDGELVALANAFPDVVVGSPSEYTWRDIAAVRYLGTNIPPPAGVPHDARMYDRNAPAWTLMPAIAAWRYAELGERVLWVDVSPSVPDEVLIRTRRLAAAWEPGWTEALGGIVDGTVAGRAAEAAIDEIERIANDRAAAQVDDLTFIAEELWEFDLVSSSADALTGPLPVCVGAHGRDPKTLDQSLRFHLRKLEQSPPTRRFLGGISTHDCVPPPTDIGRALQMIFTFLPKAIPFVFSGAEWSSQVITNAEFGIVGRDGQRSEAELGLFNEVAIDWRAAELERLPFAELCELRDRLDALDEWDYETIDVGNRCFGYRRSSPDAAQELVVLVNMGAAVADLPNSEWVSSNVAADGSLVRCTSLAPRTSAVTVWRKRGSVGRRSLLVHRRAACASVSTAAGPR